MEVVVQVTNQPQQQQFVYDYTLGEICAETQPVLITQTSGTLVVLSVLGLGAYAAFHFVNPPLAFGCDLIILSVTPSIQDKGDCCPSGT
jgi:hypothetical protein